VTPLLVSRRINGERFVLAGWSRAILMQMAHPLIAAGVADHSSFKEGPVKAALRLRETVAAMLALTFGSDDVHARTIGRILAIHRRVHGQLGERVGRFPAGTSYSAEDPALVLWVHLTLLESTVLAHEALVGPLAVRDRDAYCDEAAPVAIELGAIPSLIPRTWTALLASLDDKYRSDTLAVGPQARFVAEALLSGPFSRLAGPAGWINRRITVGWLPASIRTLYGFEWSDRNERQLARILGGLRQIRRASPAVVALWPDARRDARRRRIR
jgi:uncharacterized protein (DUF2236 family)